MTTRSYAVDGMSCEHCVRAITSEVTKVPGVADVTVDLAGNTVDVTGKAVDEAAVRAAIDGAGYAVVG
ncbi:MAG: heavy-metal-associated domain-containing protein [Actinomycetes bacterium]